MRAGLALLLSLTGASAMAQGTDPAAVAGANWLAGRVQADGSLTGEAASQGLPAQQRAETLATLAQVINATPAALADAQATAINTEVDLATRQALGLVAASRPGDAVIARIKAARNADGGFGAYPGARSDSLDTALALLALRGDATIDAQIPATALGFLRANAASDGSHGFYAQSRVYVTAYVMLAAAAWRDRYEVGAILEPATTWLLARRVSGHYAESADDALALMALSAQTADAQVLDPIATALRAAQSAQGDWGNDNFVTALAASALWRLTQVPPAPTTGTISGTVAVSVSNAPLVGATVILVEQSAFAATSAADGSFVLGSVPPGTYTVRASAVGYSSAQASVTVQAGRIVQVGRLSLTAAPLSATLTGVVRNSSGTVIADVIVAVGTATTSTNASGAYTLTGLNAGPNTITMSKSGFQTLTTNVSFEAGRTYTFSPTLLATGAPPPTDASVKGRLLDSVSNAAISGATVVVGAKSAITGADGRFNLTALPIGAFDMSVTATAYGTTRLSGTLAGGANDVGDIKLTRLPTSSNVGGVVTDLDSGLPVAGATVLVQGTALQSITDVNGAYRIVGIANTSFQFLVTATGYNTATFDVALPQHGEHQVNLRIARNDGGGNSGLSFREVRTSKPEYGPYDEFEVEAEAQNSTATDAAMAVEARVLDAGNQVVFEIKANPVGLGQNPPNLPIAIPANAIVEIEMERILLRHPAGTYTVQVRGFDSNGRVVAQGTTQFTVREQALVAGNVVIDPPLTQAGTGQPVHFQGELTNTGNLPIPAGDYDLKVTLEAGDTLTSTQPRTDIRSLFNAAPLNRPRGATTDAAGNVYIANNDGKILRLTPAGALEAAFTVATNVPLADVAVQSDGTLWAVAVTGSRLFRITPAGTVTESRVNALSTARSVAVASNGDQYIVGDFTGTATEYRLVRRTPAGDETVLISNGLAEPLGLVREASGSYLVTNQRDGTISRVSSDGRVEPYLSGFNRPYGLAFDAAGNLFVVNGGNNTLTRVATDGTRTVYASGLNQPSDIAVGPDGAVYLVNRGDNAILRIPSAGVVQVFASGLAYNPQDMIYDATGKLIIANDDGTLRQKDASDHVTVIAQGLSSPRGMLLDTDGSILIANYGNGQVRRYNAGTLTTFATGLNSPYGVGRGSPDGLFYVTENNVNRIAQVNASGTIVGRLESSIYYPTVMRPDGDDRVFILNNGGSVSVRDASGPRIFTRTPAFGDFAPDGAGGMMAISNRDVYRVDAAGVGTRLITLAFTPSGIARLPDGTVLLTNNGGSTVHRLDATNTVSVYSTLTERPREIVTDATGVAYVRTDSAKIWKIATDGTATQFFTTPNLYVLSIDPDGRPIVFMYTSANSYQVQTLDPTTGVGTLVQRNLPYIYGIAVNRAGRLTVADYSNYQLLDYAGGAQIGNVPGYISPRDIQWDGSKYFFHDQSYMYSFVPGEYPKRLGGWGSTYISLRGSNIICGASGNLYRWNGSGGTIFASVAGANDLRGVAVASDNSLAVGNFTDSRVILVSPTDQITREFAGLVGPQGLTFAANGDLYVGNNTTGTVLRFPAGTESPEVFARGASSVRHLAFDGTGRLWITRSTVLSRIDPITRVMTDVASDGTASLWSVLIDGSRVLAADSARAQIRELNGSTLRVLSSGITSATAVRLNATDTPYVASRANGTVSRLNAGRMEVLVTNLVNPAAFTLRNDGTYIVVGDQGAAYDVALDGTATDMRLAPLVASANFTGITRRGTGFALFDGAGSLGTAYELTVTAPEPPPPVGTVVHTARVAAGEFPVGEGLLAIDFGQWVPPYGGDFKAEVSRAGIDGKPANFLHVGPYATAVLTTDTPTVPAGDRTIPLKLRLNGADFTSISRVESAAFRRLVNISFPKGMIADRAGNLYYTDTTALYRVTPAGVATPILTGQTVQFGLTIDSRENLYFVHRNGSRYELIRVAPDGTRTVAADLGTTAVNGVAVNSADQILVGRTNALLRVDPTTGSIATVTTTGLGSPLGVVVDGRDNAYVQNSNHVVTQILPDGRTRTIFSRADGVVEPVFEGDGYPTITADCADNFYITASQWTRINQSGEEHILAQVVPRTGQVVALFDVTRFNPSVGDIDYLSFDRFGNRILMWDHNTSWIYQVPVTCGAIGVEAHLFAKRNQSFTGFDLAPATVLPLADGRTEYVWSLRDVTASGAEISFATLLRGLTLGETRTVADSGHILFKNSFSPTDVRLPVLIPSVQVTNAVGIAVTTDRGQYQANSTAQITTTLTNANTTDFIGDLAVEVYDLNNELVGLVQRVPVVIPAGGNLPVAGEFAIADISPGTYKARAVLTELGLEKARADASFVVLADDQAGTATSRLSLDRLRYEPNDRVTITSQAVSESANVTLENLTLNLQVKNGNGDVLMTKVHAIAQLLPRATQTFETPYLINNAAPGIYTVFQSLNDAQGHVLHTRVQSYEVRSSGDTGAGLTGTLAAQPHVADVGTPILLSGTLTNAGNADLTGVPVRLVVLDVDNEAVVWQTTLALDIARGATVPVQRNWPTTGVPAGRYTVALMATIGGTERRLASDEISLNARTISVEATQRIDASPRVLVLITCKEPDIKDEPCEVTRERLLNEFFTERGIEHLITFKEDEFDIAFSSGAYNVYWLVGRRDKINPVLADELREAVFRGEGLIVDGDHDTRNHVLDEVLGVKYVGKLPQPNRAVSIPASAVYPAAEFIGHDSAIKYTLSTGTSYGVFRDTPTWPALLANTYGYGKSATFSFDMVGTLFAAPTSTSIKTIIDNTVRLVTPPARTIWHAYDYAPVTTTVTNTGVAVDLDVIVNVPTGLSIERFAPDTPTAGAQSITWRVHLEPNESRDLDVALRLGNVAGTFTTTTVVKVAGSSETLRTLTLPITTVTRQTYGSDLVALIQALPVTASAEVNARNQTVTRLNNALTAINNGDYSGALNYLLLARDRLSKITSVDTKAARAGLGEVQRINGWLWYLTQI